jgi:hypothetical protein
VGECQGGGRGHVDVRWRAPQLTPARPTPRSLPPRRAALQDSKWDEWVPSTRLMPKTPDNDAFAKANNDNVRAEQAAQKAKGKAGKAKPADAAAASTAAGGGGARKR